jgi:hypothetical protein
MTPELKKIIESANGTAAEINRYRDLEKTRVKGSINVLVEDNLFQEIDYVSDKFQILIISKDQFYDFCLKQHLAHSLIG